MAITTKTKIGIAVVLCACIAFIVSCIVLALSKDGTGEGSQFECAASQTNQKMCEDAGCIWTSAKSDLPKCTLPKESPFGYVFASKSVNGAVELKVKKGSFFGKDFKKVTMTVKNINSNVLRVKFEDAEEKRYQVPVYLNEGSETPNEDTLVYNISYPKDQHDTFYLKVGRRSSGTTIFDSSVGSLFLADRHVEITTKLPSENVYGIGENTHTTFKHDLLYRKWPLFSRDQFPDPNLGQLNLYGVHPFYTCLEKDGKSHGVLFLNSNAMEVMLTPMPSLTFRSSGGILDLLFFVGDSPEHVVQLYTQTIGRPMIPPYWALGFQLSRYGFNSLDNVKSAIQRTKDQMIPLDVVHMDIDHMENNKDFTYNEVSFKGLPEFVSDEKKNGLRVIIIIDPALLANDQAYEPYISGEREDVYINWPKEIKKKERGYPSDVNQTTDIMFGKVWPLGPVAFPDFFKENTRTWWIDNIKKHRQTIDFDAIWIDMNEPSVFGTDSEKPWYCNGTEHCWSLKCPEEGYDSFHHTFYPAAVSAHKDVTRLSDKTICMSAIQGDKEIYRHYDVHSLYGWSQTECTYRALLESAKEDQLPLVISRSTYPSSGRFTGHWLGDNRSTWEDMRNSIIGMLEFNLFGIPYVGADICGFFLNTTSELCGRWMQLGSFYPFSRNHNNNEAMDQDPGNKILMEDKDIARAKIALETRYQLLPYLHTLHYLANKNGNTVVRPLFHEFPLDPETYKIQEQFLWGQSLLISPALYKEQKEIKFYLPEDLWYDFYNGSLVQSTKWQTTKDTDQVPLHVRGGHILPLKEKGAKNTKESRQKMFEIRVYPKNSNAEGSLFWMSEKSRDPNAKSFYSTFDFQLKGDELNVTATSTGADQKDAITISTVLIYGLPKKPTSVKYDGNIVSGFNYDDEKKILTISDRVYLLQIKQSESKKYQWFY